MSTSRPSGAVAAPGQQLPFERAYVELFRVLDALERVEANRVTKTKALTNNDDDYDDDSAERRLSELWNQVAPQLVQHQPDRTKSLHARVVAVVTARRNRRSPNNNNSNNNKPAQQQQQQAASTSSKSNGSSVQPQGVQNKNNNGSRTSTTVTSRVAAIEQQAPSLAATSVPKPGTSNNNYNSHNTNKPERKQQPSTKNDNDNNNSNGSKTTSVPVTNLTQNKNNNGSSRITVAPKSSTTTQTRRPTEQQAPGPYRSSSVPRPVPLPDVLPNHWEVKYDPKNAKPFYIDHQRKITTWTHPLPSSSSSLKQPQRTQSQQQQLPPPPHYQPRKLQPQPQQKTQPTLRQPQSSQPTHHQQPQLEPQYQQPQRPQPHYQQRSQQQQQPLRPPPYQRPQQQTIRLASTTATPTPITPPAATTTMAPPKGNCCASKSCGSNSKPPAAAAAVEITPPTTTTAPPKGKCCASKSCGSNKTTGADAAAATRAAPETAPPKGKCCASKSCGSNKTTASAATTPSLAETAAALKQCCGSDDNQKKSCCSGNHSITALAEPVPAAAASKKSCCGSNNNNGKSCCGPKTKNSNHAPFHSHPDHSSHQQTHHHHDHPETYGAGDSGAVCLAVLRENNETDIVIFDASGIPKTFHYDQGDIRSLCFETHHPAVATTTSKGEEEATTTSMMMADTWLTPCFDHNGNHHGRGAGGNNKQQKKQAVDCRFCPIETPHIHAHLYDPKVCKNNNNNKHGRVKEMRQEDGATATHERMRYLATQTLHPVPEEKKKNNQHQHEHDEEEEKDYWCDRRDHRQFEDHDPETCRRVNFTSALNISVSKQMPKECNSSTTTTISASSSSTSPPSSTLSSPGSPVSGGGRRILKIRHEDHYDYLVHNKKTGNLHLEHPCSKCGKDDIHGRFRIVAKRTLRPAQPPQPQHKHNNNNNRLNNNSNNNVIQFHIFEVEKKPFNILEFLSELFDTNSADRVAAVEHMMEHPHHGEEEVVKQQHGSSSPLIVKCCSGSCAGTTTSTEQQQQPELKSVSFQTAGQPPLASSAPTTKPVTTKLSCKGICCPAEIPVVRSVLDPLDGVQSVRVNVPLKQILVDHDPNLISAAQMEQELNRNHLRASILRDGGSNQQQQTAATMMMKKEGRSTFHVEGICCASEIPAIHSILDPLDGVSAVSINVTNKLVYVDHTFDLITAEDIAEALNNQGFDATTKVDGAVAAAAATAYNSSLFVQSILELQLPEEGGKQTKTSFTDEKHREHDHDDHLYETNAKKNLQHHHPDNTPKRYNQTRSTKLAELDTETLHQFLSNFTPSQMESFVVDLPKKSVMVVHNPFLLPTQDIVEKLRSETGIVATIAVDGADPTNWSMPVFDNSYDCNRSQDKEEDFTYPRATVMLSGVFWIISMFHYFGGYTDVYKYVGLLSVAFGLPIIAIKAINTLRRCQFDTNCLMLFASIGAVALQEYSEAAAVVFLFTLSEWLEVRATSRARFALKSIVQLRPDKANLIHPSTKELIVVPAASVPVGALVSVKTGDKVPCDGVVVEGQSAINESSLTGESRPIRKSPGDEVSGGTVNSGISQLVVRTTCSSEDSAVSRLIRLVEEAQANRSETEKLVDEFAKFYTPVIVVAALLMCSIPWAFGPEVGKLWTNNGLILIVVACLCALIISTPVSYVAGLAATAQKGVLIKGGANLEALGLVKHIMFDKTGTLTSGDFSLLHLKLIGKRKTRNEVFQYLSLMEERASHPVAQAIIMAARNEKIVIPRNQMVLEKHTIIAGEGVKGVINGSDVFVGNERLFNRLGLLDNLAPSDLDEVNSWKALGGTVGFMSIQGQGIVCAFCAADKVRSEAVTVVQRFKKQGLKITMLTGDNQDAAEAIGKQIGLTGEGEILARLLPEEKLDFVETSSGENKNLSIISNPFSSKRLVLMCGDGVNDAPALAAADIGVAMGAGAALAMETADVTLLDSNLEKLEYSMHMGRRVIRKIKQNIVFSLAVKFTVLGFALAGKTNLWAAIGSDVGAMLLVTLNSMLLLPARQRIEDVDKLKGDIEQSGREEFGDTTTTREKISPCKEEEGAPPSCKKGCCSEKAAPKKFNNNS